MCWSMMDVLVSHVVWAMNFYRKVHVEVLRTTERKSSSCSDNSRSVVRLSRAERTIP